MTAQAASATTLPPAHHIGIIVRDATATSRTYEALGHRIAPPTDLRFDDALVHGRTESFTARYVFCDNGGVVIELIEPLSDGPYAEFLAEHGEGVHHIAHVVADLDTTVRHMEDAGAAISIRARIPGSAEFAYLSGAFPGHLLEVISYESGERHGAA